MESHTIYFKDTFSVDDIDTEAMEELFNVEIGYGHNYINVYTLDKSIVDSIADELGRQNVEEVCYEN